MGTAFEGTSGTRVFGPASIKEDVLARIDLFEGSLQPFALIALMALAMGTRNGAVANSQSRI